MGQYDFSRVSVGLLYLIVFMYRYCRTSKKGRRKYDFSALFLSAYM